MKLSVNNVNETSPAPSAADLGELDGVALVERCGKEFLHFTNGGGEGDGAITLFVQHFNEEACEEIKVGQTERGLGSNFGRV